MEIKPKDLIDLIKTCKKNGVFSLKIGNIEIVFTKTKEDDKILKVFSEKEVPAIVETINDLEEAEDEVEDYSTLHIADPTAFEEELITGTSDESLDQKLLRNGV